MIRLDIPGRHKSLEIEHLVLDVNGTIAHDGSLLPGVAEALDRLLPFDLRIVAMTADTHGTAEHLQQALGIEVKVIDRGDEERQKAEYVEWLGADRVVAIGNGANDAAMLAAAAVGICVIGGEGAAGRTLAVADVVVNDVVAALDSIAHPARLVATLRC